jgi:TRAP-type C4-dicarboxylate transport system substrate-binding protein
MKYFRTTLMVSISVLFVFFLTSQGFGQEKKTIRIGSPFKPGSILVDAAEKFKELVARGSGGRIEVQIDAGTKSEEAINKLNRTGEIEM